MTVFFFYPFNVLFVFILANIFLAIINQTYRYSKDIQDQEEAAEEDDDKKMDMIQAILFCFNAAKMQSEKSKAARSQRKKLQDDGAQKEDHLEVFDKLTLNLQDN